MQILLHDKMRTWVKHESTSNTSSKDLRDAYTGSLEETILTEVVANALDSGATRVRLLGLIRLSGRLP
jgi:hypothetical protein